MDKIALIIPNNIWVSPYINIYTRLFNETGVDYDIISWNREGRREDCIQFQYKEKSRNQIFILLSYVKYSLFVKKTIKRNKYKGLVVFTPQVGIFLSLFLKRYYKNRYIFDYRDLSLEQNRLFSKLFKSVLSNSYANVISSPGFMKYLPSGFNYIISHNFNTELVRIALNKEAHPYSGEDIKILTIGALRTDMNIEVMDALGNLSGYDLSFVGKGISAAYLEDYSKSKHLSNVEFTGYYKKEEEPAIFENNTFVNIVYPLIPSHISALSNRFYNSLIFKRPMIVTKGTTQGDYVQKYGVGLVVEDCVSLNKNIKDYIKSFVFDEYSKRCNNLLTIFLEENKIFEDKVALFVNSL